LSFVVWFYRRSFPGVSLLTEAGKGFAVPQDYGQTADKRGSRNDHAREEGLYFGAGFRVWFRVLRFVWHGIAREKGPSDVPNWATEILNCV
jgi:hypothetical protein